MLEEQFRVAFLQNAHSSQPSLFQLHNALWGETSKGDNEGNLICA